MLALKLPRERGPSLSLVHGDDGDAATDFERRIAALVGPGRLAIAVGAVDYSLQTLLDRQGCRLVQAPGVADDGRRESCDVVLALDISCHAADAEAMLRDAKSRLREGGFLVTSIANAAHGQERVAMLLGRVPDPAGQRPMTFQTAAALLEKCDFAVGRVERETAPIVVPEDADRSLVPDELIKRLNADDDATTSRYLIAAYPVPWPGMSWLHQRLREQSEEVARAERRAQEANDDLDVIHGHLAELVRLQEDSRRVDRELREQLLAAHQELARRDGEVRESHARLAQLNADLARSADRLAHVEAARDSAEANLARLRRGLSGRARQAVKALARRVRRLGRS